MLNTALEWRTGELQPPLPGWEPQTLRVVWELVPLASMSSWKLQSLRSFLGMDEWMNACMLDKRLLHVFLCVPRQEARTPKSVALNDFSFILEIFFFFQEFLFHTVPDSISHCQLFEILADWWQAVVESVTNDDLRYLLMPLKKH